MWLTDIHIQTYFTLLCGIVGLLKISRLSFNEKLILWIVWQNCFVDLFATYLAVNKLANLWLYNIHLPIQYTLTLLVYSSFYKQKKRFIIYIGMAIVISFSILNNLFIQQSSFNTYTIFLSGAIIAVFSYLQLRNYVIKESNLFSKLSFWFITANFIYFIISINSLNSLPLATKISHKIAMELISINYFAYILWSILIAIGFLCIPKKTISYLL